MLCNCLLQCCYSGVHAAARCTHALCRIRYRTSLPTQRHFIPKVSTRTVEMMIQLRCVCAHGRAVCAGHCWPNAGPLLRATQADRTEVCVPNDYIHLSSCLWLVQHWNSPSRPACMPSEMKTRNGPLLKIVTRNWL